MARRYWSKSIAWIAFVVALAALVLAWLAFNRSNTDIQQVVDQEVEEATVDLRAEIETLQSNDQTDGASDQPGFEITGEAATSGAEAETSN